MVKKTVNYKNFNGDDITEELYFNLTKTELIKLQNSMPEGFDKYLDSAIKNKDVKKIMEIFEKIILLSYGEKSEDGKHFNKSDSIRENFQSTEAYDEIFTEFLEKPDEFKNFIEAVIPQGLVKDNSLEKLGA